MWPRSSKLADGWKAVLADLAPELRPVCAGLCEGPES
jgi:hypothetical protein